VRVAIGKINIDFAMGWEEDKINALMDGVCDPSTRDQYLMMLLEKYSYSKIMVSNKMRFQDARPCLGRSGPGADSLSVVAKFSLFENPL
jgi:hypothetical protein